MDPKHQIDDGCNLQHIYEADAPVFRDIIDHPSWYSLVEHYMGRGTPFMHELFLNIRGPGGYIGLHSGGPNFSGRGWGLTAAGDDPAGVSNPPEVEWSVGYMSIIIALKDIGPGDGATALLPGSHKSMISHPDQQQMVTEGSLVTGAEEMYLRAGDALLFNDSLCHGSVARINEGERRVLCFRYLPKETATNRWGYKPSDRLMAQLTPRQRDILTERDYQQTENSHVPPTKLAKL